MKYISNAFSLQMLQGYNFTLSVDRVSPYEIFIFEYYFEDGGYTLDRAEAVRLQNYRTGETRLGLREDIVSVVGHADTAAVLGVPCNRASITLNKGDVLFVAQLQGGRLPEGATTLPEGYEFAFFRVVVN